METKTYLRECFTQMFLPVSARAKRSAVLKKEQVSAFLLDHLHILLNGCNSKHWNTFFHSFVLVVFLFFFLSFSNDVPLASSRCLVMFWFSPLLLSFFFLSF